MTSGFKITNCGNHVCITLDPHFHFTCDSTTGLHRTAADFAQRHGMTRLLIEGDAPECRMGMLEVYELGKMVVDTLKGVTTAYCLRDYQPENILDPHGNPVGKLEFLKNVILNRGGNVRFFSSNEETDSWLRTPCFSRH